MSENIQFEDRINEVVKELDEATSSVTETVTTIPENTEQVLEELNFGNEQFDIKTDIEAVVEKETIMQEDAVIETVQDNVAEEIIIEPATNTVTEAIVEPVTNTVSTVKETILEKTADVKATVIEHAADANDVIAHHEGPFRDPYFWVLISFIIFVILAFKYGKKPLLDMLDKRTEDIRSELEEAERLKVEAQDLLASYQRKYKDAMQVVDEIKKQSKDANKQLKAEAKAELNELLKRREEQLLERIKRAEQSAVQEVKEKAAEIASTATKSLITDYLNDNSNKLIDTQISSLPKKI